MKCKRVRSLLPSLLLGELVGKEHEEALSHLEQCPTCADDYDTMKRANGILRADEETAPASWRRNRTMEAIRAEIQRHAAEPEGNQALSCPFARRRRLAFLSAAALILVGAAVAAILALMQSGTRDTEATAVLLAARGRVEIRRNAGAQWVPAVSGEKLLPGDRVLTRGNSYARLDFSDGYTVDLGAATGIQVGMADPSGKLSVVNFFHGRAWFEVSASRARDGLLIYAPGGVLKARSAKFEVSY